MKRTACALVMVALFSACGGPKPAPAPPSPPAPAPQHEAPATPPPSTAPPSTSPMEVPPDANTDVPTSPFTVTIVDLDDKPIKEVASIVTEAANAFDDPLVRGSITGADGRSDLVIPRDREAFVRGWDPTLTYFANSFITVAAGDAPLPAESKLVMAPAAQLTAQLYGPDGTPLPADTQIELMFSHPEQGPWWPVRGATNAEGRVIFDKVPAGKFDLNFYVEGVGQADVPGTLLMPKQMVDLGVVGLK